MADHIVFRVAYSVRGVAAIADIWASSYTTGEIHPHLLRPPGAGIARTNRISLSASSWEELEERVEEVLEDAQEAARQALLLLRECPDSREIYLSLEEAEDGD